MIHSILYKSMLDAPLHNTLYSCSFFCSLQNIISDLTLFMDLFDNLSKLSKSSDESSPSVLDSDYKHSVLGKYMYIHVL